MMEWWYWAALGLGLLALDVLLLNSYYLLWFGAGALGAAMLAAGFPQTPLWAQIAVFAALSLILLALWTAVLRPRRSAEAMRKARGELPGQAGVVVSYNEREKRGKLRLQKPIAGRDVWDFHSESPCRLGDRVMIDDVAENGVAAVRRED